MNKTSLLKKIIEKQLYKKIIYEKKITPDTVYIKLIKKSRL